MKASIKKVRDGRWFVSIEGQPVTAVFPADEHDEAVKFAYDKGCDEFSIRYSSQVSRSLGRDGIEYFVLRKMKV